MKKFKSWTKITSQIKFKNAIRFLVKLKRKEPHKLEKTLKIFKQVDRLFAARNSRMSKLRKQMADRIIQQNSVKLAVVQRMDNLSKLSVYHL